MGMDYQYMGSASYPRFDKELCDVAAVFGGIKTEYLKEREKSIDEKTLAYWFGFLSSDDSKEPKFLFPEGTDEVLVEWFNNIYKLFLPQETKIVWKCVSQHPEIKEISSQIWGELENCALFNDSWYIS